MCLCSGRLFNNSRIDSKCYQFYINMADALSIIKISIEDRKCVSFKSPFYPVTSLRPKGEAIIMSAFSKLAYNLNKPSFFLLNAIPILKSSSCNLSSSQNSESYLSLFNTYLFSISLSIISMASPLNGERISTLHLVNPKEARFNFK